MKSPRRTSSKKYCPARILPSLRLPSSLPETSPSSIPSLKYPVALTSASPSAQAIQQNHPDIAKIYAQNAIRKQNEKLNLLRLGSRIDAVASRVQTAVTMRQVTGSMAGVVKGMEGAMRAMDLEKASCDHL